jgi:formylmethanofuran dehydrogenase subunit E
VSVHQTGAGARAALGAYVKEWWEDEMHQTPMPTEINEAIDWYFEAVETEFFFIEFVEVQP